MVVSIQCLSLYNGVLTLKDSITKLFGTAGDVTFVIEACVRACVCMCLDVCALVFLFFIVMNSRYDFKLSR